MQQSRLVGSRVTTTESVSGPLPPHSLESEEALLGSILINSTMLEPCATLVAPGDFYRERNGVIYAAMLALRARGTPVDFETLTHQLQRDGSLATIGGTLTLAKLLETVPTSLHAEHYAREIARLAVMRHLISVGGKIAALGYAASDEADQALLRAEQLLASVTQRASTTELQSIQTLVDNYLASTDAQRDGLSNVIPSGFESLDRFLGGGLRRGDVVILAARPSMGKSALAMNLATEVALGGHSTVVFSLEMSGYQLAQRVLADQAAVSLQEIRDGHFRASSSVGIADAGARLSLPTIWIDETPSLTVAQIRARARRLAARESLGLVVIDYMQLLDAGTHGRGRVQEMTEISRAIKALARDLDVPILALSQLSRAVESRNPKIPQLGDLRESGAIEQDADLVWFVYRESYYVPDSPRLAVADIYIAKNRNGPTGQVALRFDRHLTSFGPLSPWRAA